MVNKELKELFEKVMALVTIEANLAYEQAAYGGRMDDGGSSLLKAQVRFFQYGLAGVLPPEWTKYREQAKQEADPEYTEYLRLQKKFK